MNGVEHFAPKVRIYIIFFQNIFCQIKTALSCVGKKPAKPKPASGFFSGFEICRKVGLR